MFVLCDIRLVQAALILHAADNFARTEAAGANIHFPRGTVNDGMDGLNVGCPSPFGLPIGMAHQIAGHNALIANLTKLGHALHLLADCKRNVLLKHRYYSG